MLIYKNFVKFTHIYYNIVFVTKVSSGKLCSSQLYIHSYVNNVIDLF